MAEAMTVETIVEADWQMQGFWTKLRVPLQTPKGGWSDIDILAYNPETRELVIAESKVSGPKKAIYAYTKDFQKRGVNILQYDKDYYFSFLQNIKWVCKDGEIFSDFKKMVNKLIIQLVSNYVILPDVIDDAKVVVRERIQKEKDVPSGVDLEIRLESTLDVLIRIIKKENENDQGRRYGHPVVDIVREINRYMHPQIHDVGRDKAKIDSIKNDFSQKLSEALGINK